MINIWFVAFPHFIWFYCFYGSCWASVSNIWSCRQCAHGEYHSFLNKLLQTLLKCIHHHYQSVVSWFFSPLDFSTMDFHSWNFLKTSLLFLRMYIHTYLDSSSINVTKYSAPLSDFTSNLPQTSMCTISSSFVARLPPDFGNEEWWCFPSTHGSQNFMSFVTS